MQGLWSSSTPVVQLMTLATLFAFVAWDVILPDSLHLLQRIDEPVHAWVATNVPLQARLFADRAISDTPIVLGAVGCVASVAAITRLRPRQGLTLAGLVAAINYFGARPVLPLTHLGAVDATRCTPAA